MYRPAETPTVTGGQAELEHGTFTDRIHEFSVRSATTVPGVVRVHALHTRPKNYWVLVLTDVGSDRVDAVWCGTWADRSIPWKAAFVDWAFHLYFTGSPKLLRNDHHRVSRVALTRL
jgi:hypothetical protein